MVSRMSILEQYEKERLAQVDGVVHVRVVEGMGTGFYGEQKGLYLFSADSQSFGLHHDGRERHGASVFSNAAISSLPTERRHSGNNR